MVYPILNSIVSVSQEFRINRLMIQSAGDAADSDGYDVIVGKLIGTSGQPDIIENELSELEIVLNEVRIDIPAAKIIAGSYWR